MGVERNSLEPDPAMYENVVFIDEYPELAKRVWLRRLAAERVGKVVAIHNILPFPPTPDDVA